MIEFIELTAATQDIWNEYAKEHPHSEIHHLAQWAKIYEDSYNYKPYYFLLQENSRIVGLLPFIHQKGLLKNIIVTSPAGILLDNPHNHNQEVFRFISNLKNRLNASDIVIYNNYNLSHEFFVNWENIRVIKYLPDTINDLEKDIGKKRRWGVRKAEENGFTHTIIEPSFNDLKVFYKIYSTNYRDLGTPVHSEKFFRKQLEYLHDNIRMMIVTKDNQPVCVKWLFIHKSGILSSESAALRRFFPLRINYYQIFHAIKYSVEHGFKKYNMGRSQKETGAHSFKQSWGNCEIQEYPVYRMKNQSGISEKKKKYKLFIKVWQKTPLAITNIAGPILRKNMAFD